MKRILAASGCALASVVYPLMMLLGAAIHVWTIVIAFETSGLVTAIFSAALPVLAQLYWGVLISIATGTFANVYCVTLVAYVVLWLLMVGGMMLTSK